MATGNRSLTNIDYLVDQDSVNAFIFPTVLNLTLAISSVSWQMKWDSGVIGKFIWEASIYPDPYCWEPMVACEAVELNITSDMNSGIVSLPHVWLTVGYVRWRFQPTQGSVGLIQSAIRIVPI